MKIRDVISLQALANISGKFMTLVSTNQLG